jgi:hypothetical protein
MVSSMFLKDYRRMAAEGVKLAPEDIIRLNALAVKAKLAAEPFAAMHLPRVVFLDGFTLREPTLGHEIWLERVTRWFDLEDERVFRYVYSFALSRAADELPDADNAKRCIRKVYAFAERKVLKLTRDQLDDAIDYAIFGADWTAGELAAPREGKAGALADESLAVGVMCGAVARRLPLTLDEAKRMTLANLLEIQRRAEALDGKFDPDEAKKEPLADYIRTREEIRQRAKATDAGQGGSRG